MERPPHQRAPRLALDGSFRQRCSSGGLPGRKRSERAPRRSKSSPDRRSDTNSGAWRTHLGAPVSLRAMVSSPGAHEAYGPPLANPARRGAIWRWSSPRQPLNSARRAAPGGGGGPSQDHVSPVANHRGAHTASTRGRPVRSTACVCRGQTTSRRIVHLSGPSPGSTKGGPKGGPARVTAHRQSPVRPLPLTEPAGLSRGRVFHRSRPQASQSRRPAPPSHPPHPVSAVQDTW